MCVQGTGCGTFGANVFDSDAVTLSRGYDKKLYVNVDVNEHAAVKTLVAAAKLPAAVRKEAMKQQTFATLQAYLTSSATKQQQAYQDAVNAADAIEDVTQKASALEKAKSLQESAEARQLLSSIPNVEAGLFGIYIWQQYLKKQLPKFLYFDEYYQMTGQVNVQKLKERQAENRLENSDHPMLGLLALGRLNLDQLLNPQNTQALKNKLEGASNHLSNKILQYWSQNKHLHVRFDVRPLCLAVPHPVPWTHICAMPPGVAHTPRAPQSACDTQASRDARSGCTAPRSRPRRRERPRGSERFGRGSLAP